MQRWSKLFIPTLREAPADAEVASHKLLLRAGYIRQLGAGLYSYLPLGQRAVNKIIAIVREEMDTIAQEFLLPALNPKEVWEESGRWTGMGDNMFRLKDRKGAELCLGMTHEEIMTSIARNELRSYKQLPQIWYQIQNKFRDEPRPKSGLLRVRQFTMKDAYSFDIDEAGLDESYRKHDEVYRRIFTRCGLNFVAVDADSGAMGGSQSQEFMVYTDAGEDLIASCGACGYAANIEKATSKLAAVEDLAATGDGLPELVHTPGQKTIEEVGAFLKTLPVHQIKTMAYIATTSNDTIIPVAVFLRGDHSVNEAKLLGVLEAVELRPMTQEEISLHFGAQAGFLGPRILPQVTIDRGSSAKYWLTPVADEEDLSAKTKLLKLFSHKHYFFTDHANQQAKKIQPGDRICFYISGKGVAAITTAQSTTSKESAYSYKPDLYPWGIQIVKSVIFDEPIVIDDAKLRRLDYFSDKPVDKWGPFVQTTREITAHDFIELCSDQNSKVVSSILFSILDTALEDRTNLVAGANRDQYHLRNVTPARDFTAGFIADVRNINEGEPCPVCGAALKLGKAVEIGHIFKLGYKYSKSMGASVLDKDGKEVTPIMGSYGIGIERILTAAIEQSAAAETDPKAIGNSMVLPSSIAPFQVVVTVTNTAEAALAEAGETIAAQLEQLGVDVLLDDRDERAGVKFKDADLVGIPYRINVGKKLAESKVELVDRIAKTSADVLLEDVASAVTSLLSGIAASESNETAAE